MGDGLVPSPISALVQLAFVGNASDLSLEAHRLIKSPENHLGEFTFSLSNQLSSPISW